MPYPVFSDNKTSEPRTHAVAVFNQLVLLSYGITKIRSHSLITSTVGLKELDTDQKGARCEDKSNSNISGNNLHSSTSGTSVKRITFGAR